MALSDVSLKRAKPREKPYKLFDGEGLYVIVTPAGGIWWRLKYKRGGKENSLSLGTYPAVSLAEARKKAQEAKLLRQKGIDPGEHREEEKATRIILATSTLEVVTREWFANYCKDKADSHTKRVMEMFVRDIFPPMGHRPISEIEPPEILAVLRKIEARGVSETAHRALTKLGQVWRYAIGTNRAKRDPTQDLRGVLAPVQHDHFAAPINEAGVIDSAKVGAFLRMIDTYPGGLIVRCAVRLAPLLFVRPGELRTMKWADVSLESAEWSFLVTKTKTRHVVPLSRQAVEILREIFPLTGEGDFVFPGKGPRPMSDGAVNAAYAAVGIPKTELTGHSWRAIARTLLHERLGVDPVHIELQLAHTIFRGSLGSAYDRTQFLPERKKMMQRWADYLDELRDGKKDSDPVCKTQE